jgi:hypothetical protein
VMVRDDPALRRDNEPAARSNLDLSNIEQLFAPDAFVPAANNANVTGETDEDGGVGGRCSGRKCRRTRQYPKRKDRNGKTTGTTTGKTHQCASQSVL